MGQVIQLSNDVDSTVTKRFKPKLAVGPSQVVELNFEKRRAPERQADVLGPRVTCVR